MLVTSLRLASQALGFLHLCVVAKEPTCQNIWLEAQAHA
ncbi:hypothetical protein CZ787_02365 [Halomonas citrativorans]|uniref:Uncharacterized protein n=1 Tax=Halomonas citrativorans TaxID=2742612 RepID=A0A1R4HQM3_9GAMM|nr:hypothetical protein CZ787_02365 [Halomonas citrativorans]